MKINSTTDKNFKLRIFVTLIIYVKLLVREPKLTSLNGFYWVSSPFKSFLSFFFFLYHLLLICKSNVQWQKIKMLEN